MFSALAEGHGNLHKKVNLFVAMAPIVFMGKTTDSTFLALGNFSKTLYSSFHALKIYEIFGPLWRESSDLVCTFFSKFCDSAAITNVPITQYVNEY